MKDTVMGLLCTSTRNNRILPVNCNGIDVISYGRINGWTFPWHPFQFIACLFLVLFAVSHFGVLVFYVPREWTAAAIIILASGYIIHFVYYILATCVDPADPAVKSRGMFLKQVFDQSKMLHVMEDLHCYICQTSVGLRTKHCSYCNKCVSDFDHHCKWMNNCVGGQNYKLFLGSVLSALGTALVMFGMDVYLVIVYYSDQDQALSQSYFGDGGQWMLFVPVHKEAYIAFTIVNGLLLVVAIGLLGHLLMFHGYLICHDMSTYEYVVNGRQKSSRLLHVSRHSQGGSTPPKMKTLSLNKDSPEGADAEEELSPSESLSRRSSCGSDSFKNRSFDHHPEREYDSSRFSHEFYLDSSFPRSGMVPTVDNRSDNSLADRVTTRQYLVRDSHVGERKLKKKRKRGDRNARRVDVLPYEVEADETRLDGSFSSVEATLSEDSRDELQLARERYQTESDAFVLNSFSAPNASRSSRASLLTEVETDARVFAFSRSESSASRPCEPPPAVYPYYPGASSTTMWFPRSSQPSTAGRVSKFSGLVADRIMVRSADVHDMHGSITSLGSRSESAGASRDKASGRSDSGRSSPKSNTATRLQSRNNPLDSFDSGVVLSRVSPDLLKARNATENLMSAGHDMLSTVTSRSGGVVSFPGVTASAGAIVQNHHQSDPASASENDENPKFEDEFPCVADLSQHFVIGTISASSSPGQDVRASSSLSNSSQISLLGALEETALTEPITRAHSVKRSDCILRRSSTSYVLSRGNDPYTLGEGIPIASLNEDVSAFALSDSLERVKKLSDAFPVVADLDIIRKRSLPQPRLRTHESMAELTVVEFSRRKKLRRKRQSGSPSAHSDHGLLSALGSFPLTQLDEVDSERFP